MALPAGLPGGPGLVVNGTAFGWGNLRLYAAIGGVDLPYFGQFLHGVQEISWNEQVEIHDVRGKGQLATGYVEGNYRCTGELKVLLEGYYWWEQLESLITGSLALSNTIGQLAAPMRCGLSRNLLPVAATREAFPGFPLLVSYAHENPTINKGTNYGTAVTEVMGLSTTKVHQEILPSVKFYNLDRSTKSGDSSTVVRMPFRVYGRVKSVSIPLL